MVTIWIDGKTWEVDERQNLLQACLGLGLDLPYFCWHPALGSVGACRQCAVIQYQNEEDQRGRLTMACMTPVSEGLRISLQADWARQFRAGIIEALMTNHPHDCPVCEEGGECHLQDMTVMSGHHRRRFHGRKRTFRNQALGPFIRHEMNRCITCYRCVRFYRDYAGGDDLHALGSRNRTYFGRVEDGVLESEFAGNLVEVCPTGVFTDKPLAQHYSRKWDLQCAPSLCVHCSLGCNTSPGERYGRLKRIQNRYHSEINRYFLCDRGRFGYDFVNHPDRLRQPLRRNGDKREAIDQGEALAELWHRISHGKGSLIGIGSPTASLEANYALRRIVGAKNFYAGVSAAEDEMVRLVLALQQNGLVSPSLRQIESADAILILGEDITQSAPRMALSVRQAVRNAGLALAAAARIPDWQDQAVRNAAQARLSPCFINACHATRLDDVATAIWRGTPQAQARCGFAIAHALAPEAPAVEGLEAPQRAWVEQVVAALKAARRPLIIAGTGAQCRPLIEAAGQIAFALQVRGQQPLSAFALPEANSLGLALLTDTAHENRLQDAFEAVRQGKRQVLLLENDLFLRAPQAQVERFLQEVTELTVLDYLPNRCSERADLLLPVTTFAESQGTLINNEGRAQYFHAVFPAEAPLLMSWRWLWASRHEATPVDQHASALLRECADSDLELDALHRLIPDERQRFGGMKVARMSPRASGRTAANAHRSVHEPRPPVDEQSALAFSMEGAPSPLLRRLDQATLLPASWYPGWNSNQSIGKFQQAVDGPLRGGPSGVRMIPPGPRRLDWFEPPAAEASNGLLLVPRLHIFGSEPLSYLSPAVASLAPAAYLALNPDTAQQLDLAAGDQAELQLGENRWQLPVRLDATLAAGLAAIPWQLPPFRGLSLPADCEVRLMKKADLIASDRGQNHA